MTAAFFLGQDVNLTLELGVGMDGAGLAQDLASFDVLLVDTTQQSADVVAGFSVVQQLVEHLDVGNNGSQLVLAQADDLDRLVLLDNATLHTTGSNGATAGDGEDVLNGHQEGQVVVTLGSGDILVNSVHQLLDAGILGSVGILGLGNQSVQSGTLDDGGVVAGEAILVQGLADFHLDQLQQLLVVNLIALVQEHNDIANADLTGQQQVLTGLSHGAVGSSDNQNSAVHLSSTGDHVLDIVSVTRAVNVSVVTLVGLVLNVSGVDRDTTSLLFGSLVDGSVVLELSLTLHSQILGDSGGQSGLAVVNMADSADVNMGLISFKLLLCHLKYSSCYNC